METKKSLKTQSMHGLEKLNGMNNGAKANNGWFAVKTLRQGEGKTEGEYCYFYNFHSPSMTKHKNLTK